jgi:hypothetical protein
VTQGKNGIASRERARSAAIAARARSPASVVPKAAGTAKVCDSDGPTAVGARNTSPTYLTCEMPEAAGGRSPAEVRPDVVQRTTLRAGQK